jgi:hypothetical protein
MQKMWMQMDIKIILWNEKKPTKKWEYTVWFQSHKIL